MANPKYERALNRSDLSRWVVHFVGAAAEIYPGHVGTAVTILHNIFVENRIRPSLVKRVTRFAPEGAACFYDAPPMVWPEIAATNPNNRQPIGIICDKATIWKLGGRPVIYTDRSNSNEWPDAERFRLVHTDLQRPPGTMDWMHEREWRVRGGLSLSEPRCQYLWWWPIVPNLDWMKYLFSTYNSIVEIYVISENCFVKRNAA